MPGKPFQSKLLPHLDFIRECRGQRMSYPQIAAELRERFGMKTAPANIHSFVRVRARRRTVYALPLEDTNVTPDSRRRVQPVLANAARDDWRLHDSTKPLEKDPP